MYDDYEEETAEGGNNVQEAFVSYGTPLDPLDEEAIPRKKPLALEDQIVTDENGRRRFHGAFTGGFSAGYFNTAGSRDGWSPAHFKSSRASRGETKAQNITDFMDAEDMGSFGFAPQTLQAKSQFSRSDDRKRKHQATDSEGPIPGDPVLNQIIQPVKDTIGVSLLRKMGWKPGQGIGPRLSRMRKRRLKQINSEMYGSGASKDETANNDNEDNEDEFFEQYKDFLFAPDDVPDFVAAPKENTFGIGYSGLNRASVLGGGHINLFGPSELKVKLKKDAKAVKIRGQAFGVGAFEDEDDDIYHHEDLGNYDFELTPANEGADRKKKPSRWDKTEEMNEIIEGFAKATIQSSVRKSFPPVVVPKDFKPRLGKRKSRFEDTSRSLSSNPTPSQRRDMLALPRELSDRAQQEMKPTKSSDQLQKLLSSGVTETAAKMSSFQPFARDPEKQNRYEKYLVCLKNNRQDALHLLQPREMTEWERDREKVEFERAAMLYRPLSGDMKSKFVSAGSSQDVTDQVPTTETLEPTVSTKASDEGSKVIRTKEEWHPAKLLCVRFNVKHPYGDTSVVGLRKKSDRNEFNIFRALENQTRAPTKSPMPSADEPEGVPEPSKGLLPGSQDEVAETTADPDSIATEPEKQEKPPIDLFKSIFLDSSDEDADDETEPVPAQDVGSSGKENFGTEIEDADHAAQKPWEKKKENILRNKEPPRGIFANVDFEALHRKTKSRMGPERKPDDDDEERRGAASTDGSEAPVDNPQEVEETFGPAKPVTSSVSVPRYRLNDSTSESDEWVEKSSDRKHHKKKKAKKKSKKKSKKKKSKHKRKDSSSSTSGSD